MQLNDSITTYFICNGTIWLEKWADRKPMECKVLHLGRNNPRHNCKLEKHFFVVRVTEHWSRMRREVVSLHPW